jgi:hypothetical protein
LRSYKAKSISAASNLSFEKSPHLKYFPTGSGVAATLLQQYQSIKMLPRFAGDRVGNGRSERRLVHLGQIAAAATVCANND